MDYKSIVDEIKHDLEDWDIERGSEAYIALEPVDKGRVRMARYILWIISEREQELKMAREKESLMDREKIEEIRRIILKDVPLGDIAGTTRAATNLYNQGYRKQGVCEWQKRKFTSLPEHEPFEGFYYKTSCEHKFWKSINSFKYCPYCGNRIEIVEDEDESKEAKN